MRTLRIIAIAWLGLLLATPSLANDRPVVSGDLIGSCDFYLTLSKEMGCGSDSYLTRFGDHYCRRFDQVRSSFSSGGAAIVEDIKTCLQERIHETENLDCENVHAIAVQSHIGCYQDAGFCDMRVSDKMTLARTVAKSVFDPTLRGTIGKVINSCLW